MFNFLLAFCAELAVDVNGYSYLQTLSSCTRTQLCSRYVAWRGHRTIFFARGVHETRWTASACALPPSPASARLAVEANVEIDRTRTPGLSLATATTNFDAQPSFSLPHRQPQPCLTTEKSRSRTPPALPSSPRMSPTSKAASSCSTRQAYCNFRSHATY